MLSIYPQNLSSQVSLEEIKHRINERFNLKVNLALAHSPIEISKLVANDFRRLEKFSKARKESFLIGRKALYANFNTNSTPSSFSFPSPHYSLSHSNNNAIAISHSQSLIKGIGIDLEFKRSINPKTLKFYLKNEDLNVKNQLPALTAWTIKEACYKATLNNKNLVLNDFKILSFKDHTGQCLCLKTNKILTFLSIKQGNCLITIALAI